MPKMKTKSGAKKRFKITKSGKVMGAGELHLVVDVAGAHVERAAENVGKAEDVVDLVRVVRA